ncbi:type IV secretory system conjugative DNA transfer family protein [Phenylobacterium deserti]|uniref:Type IV secretory system conjugative DNA transfer family protein n=1 Tax=Phenylobacterium deserti TaxID=1914756 RepID=A0A328AIU0_9CAUL|nr:type IV secretory system conjugative DNA transfer family protein [Phenylobacterium deserti]RAK52768.1 type IV secretory system conjugative DNA transfer family protein [Phenylobacterium deserti]
MTPPPRLERLARGVALAAAGLAGLLLFAALAALLALAALGQLSPELDPAALPAWFWRHRRRPELQAALADGALLAAAGLLVLVMAAVRAHRRPLHGAARWACEADLRRAGLRAEAGIVLGRKGGRPLVLGGPEHVMLYAPTRTGKGVGVVIPNLLSWPHSVVVLDVKRENWDATAGFRAAAGQPVHLFDPLEAEGRTARFNPLGHIDRADPTAVIDALQKIAAMLFPAPLRADPFWSEAARTGLVGLGAYVAATPELPLAFGSIYDLLTQGDPRRRLPQLIAARRRAGAPLPAACVQALTDFTSSSDNTFAGVRQTLTSRLNLWLNPRVRAATAASDFDLAALRSRPQSIYLAASPDNLPRLAPLYSLLLQQLVDAAAAERPGGGRHPFPVLVLLDEFARLGPAPALAHGFAYLAGYGLRLLPVLQSPAQLRAEYGPDLAEEILANCGAEIAFAPKELAVARELSARLGDTTVPGAARTRPAGLSAGPRSVSESDHRRPLLLPQELLQLPPSALLVLKAGAPPVRGRKIRYYADPLFTWRLRPPPPVPPCEPPAGALPIQTSGDAEDLSPELLTALAAEGLEPPPAGASEPELQAWVDALVAPRDRLPELAHG